MKNLTILSIFTITLALAGCQNIAADYVKADRATFDYFNQWTTQKAGENIKAVENNSDLSSKDKKKLLRQAKLPLTILKSWQLRLELAEENLKNDEPVKTERNQKADNG